MHTFFFWNIHSGFALFKILIYKRLLKNIYFIDLVEIYYVPDFGFTAWTKQYLEQILTLIDTLSQEWWNLLFQVDISSWSLGFLILLFSMIQI